MSSASPTTPWSAQAVADETIECHLGLTNYMPNLRPFGLAVPDLAIPSGDRVFRRRHRARRSRRDRRRPVVGVSGDGPQTTPWRKYSAAIRPQRLRYRQVSRYRQV